MCGIAGFLSHNLEFQWEVCLHKMTASIHHRGPDDEGFWIDKDSGIALGHRRLSILDLSPQGHQPMHSASGRYVTIFNGEIYNFQERRQELERHSAIPWRGHSDTEVMLAAVEVWGLEKAVNSFVGMFAIALWDREEKALHLVRDRLGEKPLYYGWMGNVFMFGSELKALRAHPAWCGEINRDILTLFLRHNYIPAPYSIYKGIYKLTPGTILTIKADSQHAENIKYVIPKPYWAVKDVVESGQANPFRGADTDAIDCLDSLLRSSIRQQMVSDVPLGAFLSGGVDSSTIVALMQTQSSVPIKTFTIGFHEDEYNEAEHAKAVARHLGTDHTELYVTPQEAMAVIPKLPELYDEPFSDSSQIPTFLVAQLAKSRVTVSLSGDAGDELFSGYQRYFFGRRIWNTIGWIPRTLRGTGARALTLLSPEEWDRLFKKMRSILPKDMLVRTPGDRMHKLSEILASSSYGELYYSLISHWKSPYLLVPDAQEPVTVLNSPGGFPHLGDCTLEMMFMDMMTYLPDDILVKVDRAAMGVSLETRIPFLNHKVIEFAWRVPLPMKIRKGQGKWILRQVLYKYVPKELIERPKTGFGVPLDSWLRGPLRDWAEALLDESRIRCEGFFHPELIRQKWTEHLSGKRNWQYYLWDILMFQAWLEA